MWVYIYVCVCTRVPINVCIFVQLQKGNLYVSMYACTYKYMPNYSCINMHMHIYIYEKVL